MIKLQKESKQINLTTPTIVSGGEGGYVDLSNYYTKSEVDEAISNIEVDLTGYATEDYVEKQIKNIDFPKTDLSNYYTKQETDKAINTAKQDLTPYAKKTDIPSLAGYATETYVNNAIAAIPEPENKSEVWSFTLEDGSTVNKEVLVK